MEEPNLASSPPGDAGIQGVPGAEQMPGVTFPLVARLFVHLITRIRRSPDRKHHRPRSRVDGGILDACFVMDRIGIDHREALNHTDGLAREVPRLVQPRFPRLIRDVDNQGVAIPPGAEVAHAPVESGGEDSL